MESWAGQALSAGGKYREGAGVCRMSGVKVQTVQK